MTARQHDRDAPLRTCENCDGLGGYETAVFPPSKWDDPTPGGEWIVCKYCGGSGWEEGEPEPIGQDELPPPRDAQADESERLYLATDAADLAEVTAEDRRAAREDNWFTQIHGSDAAFALRNGGQRERE